MDINQKGVYAFSNNDNVYLISTQQTTNTFNLILFEVEDVVSSFTSYYIILNTLDSRSLIETRRDKEKGTLIIIHRENICELTPSKIKSAETFIRELKCHVGLFLFSSHIYMFVIKMKARIMFN